jgi:hypothetical protein
MEARSIPPEQVVEIVPTPLDLGYRKDDLKSVREGNLLRRANGFLAPDGGEGLQRNEWYEEAMDGGAGKRGQAAAPDPKHASLVTAAKQPMVDD